MEDQTPWRLVKDGVIRRPERPACVSHMIERYVKDLEEYCDYSDTKYEELLVGYADLEKRITEIENELCRFKADGISVPTEGA